MNIDLPIQIRGHVLIKDDLGNVILDKNNAINPETMSIAIAKALSGSPEGHLYEVHFGNGGSTVSGTGSITYFPPNVTGIDADLYNPTYYKVIDSSSLTNTDPSLNNVVAKHVTGQLFSDVVINVVLDYGEPLGQQAFDDAVNSEGEFVFDEIGLKNYGGTPGQGLLLTHIIFSPIQKSLNRRLEIQYTLRVEIC